MDDDIGLEEGTGRKMMEELHDPEKAQAILEELQRMTAKLIRDDVERARHIDSFWLPRPSPYWSERLAYEPRKMRRCP